jgi:hypothetical protein
MADEKMVTVKASELATIIEMNRKLMEKENGAPIEKPREVKDRNVTVFFIDNEPVIGYVNNGSESRPAYIYEKPDPIRAGEYLPFIDVITRNHTEKPYKLNYLEFLREADRKECKVVKTDLEEWTVVQGRTRARTYEEGSYNMTENGTMVPVEVKGKTAVFTVELPDGTQCQIHERYVNINK